MGRPSSQSLLVVLSSVMVTAAFSLGCERDPAPPLLDVTELQPHEVERGDRLEIRGRGFGEGHAAKLTFHGNLHRPGQEAESATIEATGNATSRESIELTMTERLEAMFCRDGDSLAHTTFTGDLDVAFAPAAAIAGAPPIVATLHDVHLDLLPPVRERLKDDAAAEDGARFLASAGLTVDPHPAAAGGLVVTEVAKGSVAEHAAIGVGDRLTTLDQVSLDSLADARPSSASGAAAFSLRALDADVDRHVTLDVGAAGLGFGMRAGLTTSSAIVGLALALLLLFVAPRSSFLAWLELRIARRLQRLGPASRWEKRTSPRAAQHAREGQMDASLSARLSPLVALLPFLCLPFADSFGLDLDVGLLFVLLATAIALASIFGVGMTAGRTFGHRARLLAERLLDQLPAAFALGCVVLLTGSLRLREIVLAQGGMPWDWALFRTPLVAVLLVAWLSAALRRPGEGESTSRAALRIPEADMDRRAVIRTNVQTSIGVRELHLAFLAAVGAALFLGGWQLPGTAAHSEPQGMLRMAGALLFLGKSAALYATVDLAQSMIPRLDLRQRLRIAVRAVLPMALFGFVVTLAWTHLGPTHAIERAAGLATFGLVTLLTLRSAARILQASLGRSPGPAHLDPFL